MENISIELRESLFASNGFIGNYTDQVLSYSHVITAIEGYKSASFSLVGDQLELEDWFEKGLGRDIVIYDEANQVIWNGFVNTVSITIGGRTLDRGPLMEIVNRMSVEYTPLDISVNPPVKGVSTLTAVANNTDSQAKYGILADIYSAGDATDANALTVRDTQLEELSEPKATETLSLEGGGLSAKIECLGYYAYLNIYTYANAGTGTSNLSAKLTSVLGADPNTIFSTNYSRIVGNTLPVPVFEDGKRKAFEVILGEVAKGNASNVRHTFGIYKDRQAIYAAVPTTYAYEYRLAASLLEKYGGGELYPWEVLPARWLFYSDFLVGWDPGIDINKDPRSLFIESITYTAPHGLSINGGKVRTTPQLLARLGLGGTS